MQVARIKLIFLWHMHQPFYKDLVSGEYRLPWVRLHALKDYYGMVKLLDEFPRIHQTFNLVPSLLAQLEDYVEGRARDPFWSVARKHAEELSEQEKRFALTYLFQANLDHLIGRFPRYRELFQQHADNDFNLEISSARFAPQELRDLQVLSQIAWFDEFLFERPEPDFKRILDRGRNFSPADQDWVNTRQMKMLADVIPAYRSAADRGLIEISTSPYYHPILPLLCDTDMGAVSSPGLPLPREPFRYPQDAEAQLQRGLELHARMFGGRPQGVWPSEGSVSEKVLEIGAAANVRWMATDEGVLGRSLNSYFDRDHHGVLSADAAAQLYKLYAFQTQQGPMHLLFRDHSLSDLIGFVYSGMGAEDAATHFVSRVKANAQPLLDRDEDAVVPVILDGENAWEFFPRSGREFLRTLYAQLVADPDIECLTCSEVLAQVEAHALPKLVPGSWINSNFNVWIGAREDNQAWDYLLAARRAYDAAAATASSEQRALAWEELLIAEGSDWNWWYGPEHSTANDRDFDELYRKHLSNVYAALGQTPPSELAQPILRTEHRARFVPQTAYIHPRVQEGNGFFDWIGAAHYRRDRHGSAMHGKQLVFDSLYTGIDLQRMYVRIDFLPDFLDDAGERLTASLAVQFALTLHGAEGSEKSSAEIHVVLNEGKIIEVRAPFAMECFAGNSLVIAFALDDLHARIGDNVQLRAVAWKGNLPLDALPAEGTLQVPVASEEMLASMSVGEHWSA